MKLIDKMNIERVVVKRSRSRKAIMPDIVMPTKPTRTHRDPAQMPRLFYVAIALLMLGAVTYGFSHTIGPSLLHAQRPMRTLILLGIHGAVFYGWMLLVIVQAALIRARHIRLHRILGWVGAADGALVIMMGLWASFHQPAPLARLCAFLCSGQAVIGSPRRCPLRR
jgi:drug/metabolite transporter (DMT)-like permease